MTPTPRLTPTRTATGISDGLPGHVRPVMSRPAEAGLTAPALAA